MVSYIGLLVERGPWCLHYSISQLAMNELSYVHVGLFILKELLL